MSSIGAAGIRGEAPGARFQQQYVALLEEPCAPLPVNTVACTTGKDICIGIIGAARTLRSARPAFLLGMP
jgi:hypothetical protein